VTLTVLVQEMAVCQLFITGAVVLQLEIVCWSPVVYCACELFLLLFVVVCSVRAVPRFDCRRGTHTHTEHLAHDDRWEVICFHWACTRIFSVQG
jgi:hypothetical protein